MARNYAPIHLGIWSPDSKFRNRSEAAQRIYFLVFSQPGVNYCGVVPYQPHAWSQMAKDSTVGKVKKAVAELEEHSYVIVDRDTEELWIRSFVKHNNVLSQRQLTKAMRDAYPHIGSRRIKAAFYNSLPPAEQQHLTRPERHPDGGPNGSLPPDRPAGSPPSDGIGVRESVVEVEPEPVHPTSSSTANGDAAQPPRQPLEEEEDWATVEAKRRLAARRAPNPVVDPEEWVRKVAAKLRIDHPNGLPNPNARLSVVRPACDECDNGWLFNALGDAYACTCRAAS